MPPLRRAVIACLLLPVLAGCGAERTAGSSRVDAGASAPAAATTAAPGDVAQRHPDIVDVEITPARGDTFDLAVTVSSPYDTPQRYADGWRVVTPDGAVLGTHTLAHDHAGEQPFTRVQAGLQIPADVDEVTIEGRDQRYGYGGATVTVPVPHNRR